MGKNSSCTGARFTSTVGSYRWIPTQKLEKHTARECEKGVLTDPIVGGRFFGGDFGRGCGAMVGCHARVGCYCWCVVPWWGAIAGCHNVGCHSWVPWWDAIVENTRMGLCYLGSMLEELLFKCRLKTRSERPQERCNVCDLQYQHYQEFWTNCGKTQGFLA